ncbi:porin [Paraburkholderia strydomiana]|uniref:porin n=1 Tax=Paraburkholderia strydomiana TaxID=1245417 RepID=UPI001BEBC702|nr:porin [Paraburkholderia strydomiana]
MKTQDHTAARPTDRAIRQVIRVLSLTAAANVPFIAHAQSSVTLSGILDSGLLYANNSGGHAKWAATSGQTSPSRWIMTGSEDLGNGLSTVFKLTSPFNLQNGRSPGRAFNVAYVGLSDLRFGTLTFGRQWDTTIDTVANFASNETWAGYVGAHIGDNDNTNATTKISNAVKYMSPQWAGFSFGATYAFSNDTDFAENRLISAGASYTHGPLALGIGFRQADRPTAQAAGAIGSPGPGVANDYANPFTTSIASTAGVQRQRNYLAGASYQIGRFLLGGMYSRVQYHYLDATSLTLDNYEVNLSFNITPAWQTSVAYIRTNGQYEGGGTNGQEPGWDQINAGTQYSLSKRTMVYLIAAAQQGRHATAQIYGVAPSSTRRQVVATAGLAHRF